MENDSIFRRLENIDILDDLECRTKEIAEKHHGQNIRTTSKSSYYYERYAYVFKSSNPVCNKMLSNITARKMMYNLSWID